VSGGRRASLPDGLWRPVDLLPTGGGGTEVRFVAESGLETKVFDFAPLPIEAEVAQWCARVLARRFGARSPVKHLGTAVNLYAMLRMFAASLADADEPAHGPADISATHVEAFLSGKARLASYGSYLSSMRTLLRTDPELSEEARAALFAVRLPDQDPTREREGYSDRELQVIMTAVRGEVRRARDRITAGRRFLADYRAGVFEPGSREEELGAILDEFERTGSWPRPGDGRAFNKMHVLGGLGRMANRLCLTLDELSGFCLLLTAMTGENYGTVAKWPVAHYRPDGGDDRYGIALLEQTKARRGPEREHMVRPLEDLPESLAAVFGPGEDDHRLFRSPLRVYLLLLDLAEPARRLSGSDSLFCAFNANPGRHGDYWCEGAPGFRLKRWAARHGFPDRDSGPTPQGVPPVDVGRLRLSVTERRRRAVSHTRDTMNDIYLRRSRTVQEESRSVVADALRVEVAKARGRQTMAVFSQAFLEFARSNPQQAAADAGLAPQVLKDLEAGDQDTVLAGCVDNRASPVDEPGQPCTASFMTCLDCDNARALPRHLPIQITAREHLASLRRNIDPSAWDVRYGRRLAQLDDIVGQYTPAEREAARGSVTARERQLVEDLVGGRWDLR
jgi:hypothetical protein